MKIDRAVAWAKHIWERAGDGLLAVGLFCASLTLYLQTLAPSVANLFDDSLEFPLVVHRLGIAHPTGYPLYTLLAKLFTLGAGRNVVWRVNLLSAVAGALTVALVYLVSRQLTRRRWPGLLGATALAASPLFWSQAVLAEVYTLNACFIVGLLWLALRWARQPLLPEAAVPLNRRLRPHPLLYALAGLWSLSLTHHRTAALLAPALLVFIAVTERRALSRAALLGTEQPGRPRWLRIAGCPFVLLGACLLSPLLFYLYLPLRGHIGSLDGTYVPSWGGFWQWVTASGYRVFFGSNPLARDVGGAFYLNLFWQQFGPVGLALALLGAIGLTRQARALALTGLAFATYVAFAVVYRAPDQELFFLPAFLVVAIWIGSGLDYAADLLRPRGPSLALRRLVAAAGLLLIAAAIVQPLSIARRNCTRVDLSRRWIVHDFAWYALQQPLPANSTLVGLLGEMTLVRTFQEIGGLRPEVQTVAADDETARRAAVEAALSQGRATYITRPLPGLSDAHALDSLIGLIDVNGELETLIRVGEPAYEVPAQAQPVDAEPLPGLRLVGYEAVEHRGHWQAWARLRLWWQAKRSLQPFKVSARLVDGDGQVVAVTDAEPVAGAYAPTVWRQGEVVADAYEIPLPAGLPPGDYVPRVIVYDPATGAEKGRVDLTPVPLKGSPIRPPRGALEAILSRTLDARFGNVELVGAKLPDPGPGLCAGSRLPLTLLWQAKGKLAGEWRVQIWLEDGGDQARAEAPVGGRYPPDRWQDGQVVRQSLDLTVPAGCPPGSYRLKLRVVHDGRPIPWGRSFLPGGSDLDLGQVQVSR